MVIDVKLVIRHKHVSMSNLVNLCKVCALFDTYNIDQVNWDYRKRWRDVIALHTGNSHGYKSMADALHTK